MSLLTPVDNVPGADLSELSLVSASHCIELCADLAVSGDGVSRVSVRDGEGESSVRLDNGIWQN